MQGKTIGGKYELHALIGRGGMGTVWRATDRVLERPVAVKLMAARHLDSETFRERFESEARALASLQSPHVVQIYDYGVEEGTPYIVMELLDGESFETRLGRDAPMSPKAVLEVLRQITDGLTAAASLRMVHRDLKPDNVFIVNGPKGETIKLLDFGLAWMRSTELDDLHSGPIDNKIVGTPAYMSPEGLRGRTPDIRHDLWSVGVIAYKALTGRLPFNGRYLGKLIVSVCTDPAPPPSAHIPALTPAIDGFFLRALAKDPALRFRSAAELLDAFAEACRSVESTKILAVDDEPDMQELIKLRFRRQIRSRQFEFVFADNGSAALDELRRHPDVEVVITDINMPEMDGLTLLAKIPEVAPHARVIMVSAYSDMPNIRQAMNSGAFDFVVKPIDFKDLDATIKKTAQIARDQRQLAAADLENRLLRRLVAPPATERLRSLGPAALLANESDEGTIVYVDLPESGRGDELDLANPDALRELNARFELALPELERSGGAVCLLQPDAIVVQFSGRAHVQRALDACRRVMRELASLAELAGEDSPYAKGLSIGIDSGPLVSTYLGSHVVGRLCYAVLGPTVERARTLALAAAPGEVLAPGPIATSEGLTLYFEQAEDERDVPSQTTTAYAFDWARPEPSLGHARPRDPNDPESTMSVDIYGDDDMTGSLELGALAFGWTLSEN